ncbi:MAG TPA: flagellar hook-length control protein FliK [Phycisphaerales bacterium]|nr:flagellar hook-length control protein FliK [Phycisphaerales bacterium]
MSDAGARSAGGGATHAAVGGHGLSSAPRSAPTGVSQANPSSHESAGEHPRTAAFRAQLAQGLGAALRRGEGDVTLKLRPETLGELRVRVSVRGSEVDATIRASTIEAHRLLEQSVESLRAALEARGLHAGRIEVEPLAQEPRQDAGTAQQERPGHDAGINSGGESGDDGARDAAPERESGGGAANAAGDPQDDGSRASWALGASEAPGVVYGVADGAARVVMVDALA